MLPHMSVNQMLILIAALVAVIAIGVGAIVYAGVQDKAEQDACETYAFRDC